MARASALFLLWAAWAVGAAACNAGGGPEATPPPGPSSWSAEVRQRVLAMSPIPPPPPDPTNAVADDPRAAALGDRLFHDTALSANGKVACATCHDASRHFTDGKRLAEGVGRAGRNAPSVLAAPWSPWLFWDGRKDSLWSQALGPMESPVEHGTTRGEVAARIATHYAAAYRDLFGPVPDGMDGLGPAAPLADPSAPASVAWSRLDPAVQRDANRVFANAGKAIAAFERTLAPGEAPLDRFVAALRAGDETGASALPEDAVRGLALFAGPAGCHNCHHGPWLTDHAFHNLGLPPVPPLPDTAPGAGPVPEDPGRGLGAHQVRDDPFNCAGEFSDHRDCPELRYLDPGFPDFQGAFRTPSLRNVAATAPYMHSGQFSTLSQVVQFYATLPGQARLGHRELTLRPLALSPDESRDIEAFLGSLTAPRPLAAR